MLLVVVVVADYVILVEPAVTEVGLNNCSKKYLVEQLFAFDWEK